MFLPIDSTVKSVCLKAILGAKASPFCRRAVTMHTATTRRSTNMSNLVQQQVDYDKLMDYDLL